VPDFEVMYHKMFNAATNVDRRLLEASVQLQQISLELKKAQQECEEMYLSADEELK
jgi:hypothetical protein